MANDRTILLIDYDPKSIQSTTEPLERAGFKVEVANDGLSGLEAFDRLKPDLVLIEPMVPKKHGFQVCQEIKATADGRRTPVLITTGFYRGRKHRSEAQQNYGCDDYLEKPISEELLLSTCRRFLIDTQEPPIPVGDEVPEDAPLVGSNSQPTADEAPWADEEAVNSATPRTRSPELAALDDLSEDEIQARLDALIIEEPEDKLEEQPPTEPEALPAFEFDPPAPAPPAVETETAQTEAGPLPDAVGLPPPEAEPPPMPEIVFETEESPSAGDPVAQSVDGEPHHWNVVPLPTATEPGLGTVHEPFGEAERTDDRPEPSAVATAASHAGATRSVSGPLPEIEPESSSRLPMWIGLAAILCIAGGAGLLWALRDGEPTEPFAEPTPRPMATATPREPSPEPDRTESTALPTTRLEESGLGASLGDDGPVTGTGDAEGLAKGDLSASGTSDPAESELLNSNTATILPAPVPKARNTEVKTSTPTRTPPPVKREPTRRAEPVARTPVEPPPVSATDKGTAERKESAGDEVPTAKLVEKKAEPADDSASKAAASVPTPEAAATPAEQRPREQPPSRQPTTEPRGATVEAGETLASPPEPTSVEPPPRHGDLVELSEVDAVPVPSQKPAPDYPTSARSLRQQGTVVLRLLVDERGRVEQAEVASGVKSKALQGAALRAAKRWIYQPATKDGVPVKVWISEAVTFKL